MTSSKDNEPNKRGRERDIQQIIFVEVEDSECGVRGWRYRRHTYGLISQSNMLFDTFEDCLEAWQESRSDDDD